MSNQSAETTPVPEPQVSMKSLLEAGVHFGHQTHRWNPKMARYIYGSRNNIHIIDLQKTVRELKKALAFIKDVASQNKSVLFVGTKRQAQEAINQEARRSQSHFVAERWLGGTLTNFETIRKSSKRLQELEDMREKGVFNMLSKKERSRKEKDFQRLAKSLEGIKDMTELPGCLFVVDIYNEETAVLEGRKMGIPVVAVCDTNTDPDKIDYPIPGNDDAIRAIKLITSLVSDTILQGRSLQREQMAPDSSNEGGATEEESQSSESSETSDESSENTSQASDIEPNKSVPSPSL